MFKRSLSLILAAIMCLAAISAIAITPVSAGDTPAIENLYVFDGNGNPNTTTAGGPVKNNGTTQNNYATGKNFAVSAGDKIYMGPVLSAQGYHLTSYDAKGNMVADIKTANASETVKVYDHDPYLSIICYTVPEGVASLTPVFSQIFKEYGLITKNRAFTIDEYVEYWTAKNVDIKDYLTGNTTPAADIVNVSATGGLYEGRADTKAVSATQTDNLVAAAGTYACTKGYIEVKEGDIIYFVGEKGQGYHLSLYNAGKDGTTTVKKEYMVQYAELGNNYAIYAYRMRVTTAFVRYTFSNVLYEAGVALATINQPFDEATYRAWCKLQGKSANTVIGSEGTTPYDQIVDLFDDTTADAGYTDADGTLKADANTVSSKAITVKAGDVIQFGPIDKKSSLPAIVAFDSANAVKASLKASELELVVDFESGLSTLAYTVPADVTSVKVNVPEKYKQYVLATCNQPYDRFNYDEWWASTVKEGDNLWNPAVAIYGGYVNLTAFKTNATYDCTGYIPVKEGDKVYVGSLHAPQPQLGITYDADFKPKSLLEKGNFKEEFMISDNVGTLVYTVPAGVSYVRFIPRAALTEYMYISVNKPITKDAYVETFKIPTYEMDTSSPLNGKNALFIGDSITFGAGEDSGFYFSWPGRISAMTGLKTVNNGDSGARISVTGDSGFILDALTKTMGNYDMIVVHGGVNDARYNVPVGNITPDGTASTSFDTTTFAGGLETIFYRAKFLYKTADLFFITNHHLDGHNKGSAKDMSAYFNMAKKICEKYGVTVIDLYDNTELNAKLETTTTKYLPDTLHLNGAGYDVVTPYIIEALENFYDPDYNKDTEDTTTAPTDDDTTKVPEVNDTTTVPTTPTDKPEDVTTTEKPADTEPAKKGCGGFAVAAQLVMLLGAAVTVIIIKKK